MLTFHIKLVSFKNIIGQKLSNLVRQLLSRKQVSQKIQAPPPPQFIILLS